MTVPGYSGQQATALLRLLRVVERNPKRAAALEKHVPEKGMVSGTTSSGVRCVAVGSVGAWLCRRGLAQRCDRGLSTETSKAPSHLYYTLTEKGILSARQVFDVYIGLATK